jgi:UPF0755 protein
MMPTSDEHLQQLAARSRDGEPRRRRQLALAVAAVVVVLVAGALIWRAMSSPSAASDLSARLSAWWLARQADQLAPPSTDPAPVPFEIAAGESLASVADRLAADGLIRSADPFRRLARVRGLDRQIQAGQSTLRRNMTAEEVLAALMVGRGAAAKVTIPEGWRAEQIAASLAEQGIVDRAEFLRLVGEGKAGQGAVADRPAGTGLEGYLFPDTYEFVSNAGASQVLDRLLANFDTRVTPAMRAQAADQNRSLYEVVTLASIIEREAVRPEERPQIARVFLNRLQAPPYLLNADPTVQYALGYQTDLSKWWKPQLTEVDLAIDSAYNTYRYPGLPPGPIANPGLASIQAALAPTPGDWVYFVVNGQTCDGSHVFATTWEEHLANVARYQSSHCAR